MQQLCSFLTGHAETVLFVAIFAEQIGVPIPAAPILMAAGALVADGALEPATALSLTVVACVLADLIWYYIGLRSGAGLLRFLCKLSLCDASRLGRTERLFARYGMSAVTAAKFIPGLGFLIPPMAGTFGVRVGKFLRFDALGSLLYGLFYLVIGHLFSDQVSGVLKLVGEFGVAFVALTAAVLVIFIARKYAQHRRTLRPTAAPAARALATIPGA